MKPIYKNLLEKVGEEIYSRIYNIAIIDVLFTIILGYIIKSYIPKYNINILILYLSL